MVSYHRIIISVSLVFILLTKEGTSQLSEKNYCASKTTCGECIQTKDCAWCMQPYFGDRPRCLQPSLTTPSAESCSEEWTLNPDNEFKLITNRELTGNGSAGGGQESIVQLSPQRVVLKLRINERHRLHVRYAHAENSRNNVELRSSWFNTEAASSVEVTYFSSCLGNEPQIETNSCDGLRVGDLVNFEVEIVGTSCPSNVRDLNHTFQIYPVGVPDNLIIDLGMMCSCPCEKPDHPEFELNSSKCNGVGSYKCGVCECDEFHFGTLCECSNSYCQSTMSSQCRPDNSSQVDCYGRGNCVCGICVCERRPNPDEVISGQFCECDNFSCDRHNGVLCSGPDKGVCSCGVCQCNSGWTGDACDRRTTSV